MQIESLSDQKRENEIPICISPQTTTSMQKIPSEKGKKNGGNFVFVGNGIQK